MAELVRLGVAGFKIEGRLKSATTSPPPRRSTGPPSTRRVAGEPFDARPGAESRPRPEVLRGFTHGFLDGPAHRDFVHGLFPKSRGVRLGTVAGKTARGIIVRLSQPDVAEGLKPGDGVVFDQGRPDQDEPGGRVFSVRPVATRLAPASDGGASGWTDGPTVELTFGRDDVDCRAVPSATWSGRPTTPPSVVGWSRVTRGTSWSAA